MVTALDVDTGRMIAKAADRLKGMGLVKPTFVGMVKSGADKERVPEDQNFWYIRCASVLYQAYTKDVIGTNSMRTHYGGRKNRGKRPQRTVKSGGSTIRKAMQELEKHGLLEKTGKKSLKNKAGKEIFIFKGRKLTGKGRKLMDSSAKEIATG